MNILSNHTAVNATLHCLTGCAIGEISGLVIGAALSLSNLITVILSIALAFLFGYKGLDERCFYFLCIV